MRKVILAAAMVGVLLGCTTTEDVRGTNRERLLGLSQGMSKADVFRVMGKEKITIGVLDRTVITNPFRNEMYQSGGNNFENY
ncbi:MAG: hypothetical protein QF511_04345 [Rhodospirillales bacterium]|jgi:hypothetical protein|nr:hypothetical protein [Rhodospirillales bacterium]MDP7097736.1 hypothetical protein [Rhodospirillales bacterium]HIJ43630.1 hypothetical protein [Rhodospirillaceae bacterium]HIJ93594.1 hypothetical protein [Rhodospirillaceae bacterium]